MLQRLLPPGAAVRLLDAVALMPFAMICVLFLAVTGAGAAALSCLGALAFFSLATPLPWLLLVCLYVLFADHS